MSSPLISDLRKALGRENVLSAPSELAVYDCDALTIERRRPDAVVFPRSTQQVSEVVNLCGRHGASIVARGAGTVSPAAASLWAGLKSGTGSLCARRLWAVPEKRTCPAFPGHRSSHAHADEQDRRN